jgi:cellulose synthase/poly-beta-1,6-N-acetylglucosamine synthase-like glycosyltransferase
MPSRFRKIISYFPLRYYGASIFFAFFLINSVDSIRDVQEDTILSALDALNIPAFISKSGQLFVGENTTGATKINLPIYVQLLFLIFFPSLAFTARANFTSRAKIMLFGLLCFFAFIGIGLGSILILSALDFLNSTLLFKAVSIIASIVIGCLIIELALFSTIRIPERTKIKPVIKRRYAKEYAFLALFIIIGSIIIYSLVMFLHIDIDSPIGEYVHLYLWLNISSVVTVGYLLSNLIFEARRPSMLKSLELRESPTRSSVANRMPSVSFLIPAYNEERIAGRCIESIDKAAAKYDGEIEIIFVNDGSTDSTEKVVTEAIGNLKHCSGRLFSISNSGKGFALVYGMEKTKGEVIFRTDADSIIDEDALTPMMRHFKDPTVGSVSGFIFPIQDKGLWIKVQNLLDAYYLYTKRAQEVLDSIITQPGASTSFRREALVKAGGWKDNIFGEDGEITNRISRYGYRELFEPRSIVYSEHPSTLIGILQQRARWGVAFYHSRGTNLRLVRELRNPRSLIFLWNLASHGGGLARSLIWPYLLATTVSAMLNLAFIPEQSALPILLAKLFAIQLSIIVIQLVLYGYQLNKVKKLGDIKYYPFIRFMNLILNVVVKPQVIDVMLLWSSKWKEYSNESFKDLRRVVSRSIDPLYPEGQPKIIISSKGSDIGKKQQRPFAKSAVTVVDDTKRDDYISEEQQQQQQSVTESAVTLDRGKKNTDDFS